MSSTTASSSSNGEHRFRGRRFREKRQEEGRPVLHRRMSAAVPHSKTTAENDFGVTFLEKNSPFGRRCTADSEKKAFTPLHRLPPGFHRAFTGHSPGFLHRSTKGCGSRKCGFFPGFSTFHTPLSTTRWKLSKPYFVFLFLPPRAVKTFEAKNPITARKTKLFHTLTVSTTTTVKYILFCSTIY